MLTEEQKETVVKTVIPIFNGWKINDAVDALEYARGYISDFATLNLPPFQDVQKG